MNSSDNNENLNNYLEGLAKFIMDNFMANKDSVSFENLESLTQNSLPILEKHISLIKASGVLFSLYDDNPSVKQVTQKLKESSNALSFKDKLTEKDYQSLMNAAIKAYESNEVGDAKIMASTLIHLFPFQAQPYILFATIIWQNDSIQTALDFYDYVIQHIASPLLNLYAAECYIVAQNKNKAMQLLVDAQKMCESKSPTAFAPLLKEIQELYFNLSKA